jgi:hypothetical protein
MCEEPVVLRGNYFRLDVSGILMAVVLQKNIYKRIIKRRIRESHVGETATEKSRVRSLG